jgi:hypothetical protein
LELGRNCKSLALILGEYGVKFAALENEMVYSHLSVCRELLYFMSWLFERKITARTKRG